MNSLTINNRSSVPMTNAATEPQSTDVEKLWNSLGEKLQSLAHADDRIAQLRDRLIGQPPPAPQGPGGTVVNRQLTVSEKLHALNDALDAVASSMHEKLAKIEGFV